MYSAELVEKTSKDGNKYYVFEIKLTDNYSITAFIDKADMEIIRLVSILNKNK